MSAYLDLYDYRRRVAAMYTERNAAFRAGEDTELIWQRFRSQRDNLFRDHPQSALDDDQRRAFRGLPYFPYRTDFCVSARIETGIEPASLAIPMNADEQMRMTAVARLHFAIQGQTATLVLYWLNIYGGGLFLPFHDTTCPGDSYGGGRYLCDTIKGSDFLAPTAGDPAHPVLLDFNYAYNPSCAYNSRWVCPLAPHDNRLPFAVGAGEKKFHADT